jgi:hypothetical protein
MLSVCFRYDDASATSDHKVEGGVFEIFGQHQFPLSVAAIPFKRLKRGETRSISEGNAPHLAHAVRAGIVELAQHGHSHLKRSADTRGGPSEFAGIALDEQAKLINEGKDHLEQMFGQRISGFVPPWNTYDCATVRALESVGFAFVSGGLEVQKCGALPAVPITSTLAEARSHVEKVRSFQSLSPVIVVVVHSDDFEEYRFKPRPDEMPPTTNLDQLRGLLAWLKGQRYVKVETLGRIAGARQGISLRTVSELKLPYRVRAKVPPMLVRTADWKTVPGVLYGLLRNTQRPAAER